MRRHGFGYGRFGKHGPAAAEGGLDRHHAMRRLLAHGDLRVVVLLLIEEQPRHGYELIKLIESKSSNQYTPSPGVIYPTLTYLEETGLVKTDTLDGKRQYSITIEGIQYLDQDRQYAKAILRRLEEAGAQLASEKADPLEEEGRAELREAFHAIRAEIKSFRQITITKKKEILKILKSALAEIRELKSSESPDKGK